MNSHNIDYNNKSEIITYLAQILHEFDNFNKTLCGSNYISTDIPYIIHELMIKITKNEIFEIIFKTFEILKIYINCVDVDKFVATSHKWNIRQIHFNISNFLKSQLTSRMNDLKDKVDINPKLINKIVDEYLHTLILNVEFALCNFNLILKNIEHNYCTNDYKNMKIPDSKYKLSFTLDLENITEDNKQELDFKLKLIISDLFYVLRKLLSTSTYHLKLINENCESSLTEFIIKHLPWEYYPKIISIFECVELYIQCLDLDKLIASTEKMNVHAITFNIRDKLLQLLGTNKNDAAKDAFIKSLLNKLENIFKCVDYATTNPRTILNNAKAFIVIDSKDDIFDF